MRKFSAGLAIVLLGLSACGSRGDLTPPEGQTLPPAVYGAEERPTAEQLLKPSAQARPDRNDELLRKSESRQDDRFDLPPPE